jgi:REP element-mobilizing transposase RayT
MARPLRIECANAFYHGFSRGNERRAVFYDDRDRQHFLDLLGLLCERFEAEPWAYVLMPNHYHLVVRTLRPNLSRAMQWLGVAYTNWFNARHDRSGHLFQGRFKGILVEDDAYLRRLLLYVHRNPLRSGLAERLADYPWSSYRCLAYGRGCLGWFRPALALGLFGGRQQEFRRAVQEYSEEEDGLFENLWHGLWLGSEKGLKAFVKRLGIQRHREKPQTRAALRPGVGASVPALAAQWAADLGISPGELEELRRPRRHVSRPLRDVLIHVVWRGSDQRLSDIGAYFGVRYAGVSVASRRAEAHLQAHRRLAERVSRIIQK